MPQYIVRRRSKRGVAGFSALAVGLLGAEPVAQAPLLVKDSKRVKFEHKHLDMVFTSCTNKADLAAVVDLGDSEYEVLEEGTVRQLGEFSDDSALQYIECDRLRNEKKLDGTGMKIAILDTGCRVSHPAFRGMNYKAYDAFKNDEKVPDDEKVSDDSGHGTHVTSILFSILPKAQFLIGKVLQGPRGEGQESHVASGIQWAIENGAHAINLSLGMLPPTDPTSTLGVALCEVVEYAVGRLPVIIAAGNDGPSANTINRPGIVPDAITVGNCTIDHRIAESSSRGGLLSFRKPDIVAPGVYIKGAGQGGDAVYDTGTSFSAPFVCGIVVQLLQARVPSKNIKDILLQSARLIPRYGVADQGRGVASGMRALTGDYKDQEAPKRVVAAEILEEYNRHCAYSRSSAGVSSSAVFAPGNFGPTLSPQSHPFSYQTAIVVGTVLLVCLALAVRARRKA